MGAPGLRLVRLARPHSVVNLGKRDRERERERPCHFVLSDHAMYVLVDKHPGVAPPEDDPYKNLGVAHAGPLDTVSAIDIGLDRQTIVVRFGGKVSGGGPRRDVPGNNERERERGRVYRSACRAGGDRFLAGRRG